MAAVEGGLIAAKEVFLYSFFSFPAYLQVRSVSFYFLHFFNDVQWAKMQIAICVMLLFHRHNLFCLNVNYIIMHNHF